MTNKDLNKALIKLADNAK